MAVPALILLALGTWAGAQAGVQSQAQSQPPLSIRLESGKQAQALTAPTWETPGTVLLPLKPAVEYLGGSVSWYPATRKVLLQGPAGRKALITPGYPKAVLDGQRLFRLPHVPVLMNSQVMVSPESLLMLWKMVGDQPPVYSADTRIFRVGALAAPAPGLKPVPGPESGAAAVLEKDVPVKSTPAVASEPAVASGPPSAVPQSALCVVVDAGHGGKDPGAIGPTGLYEKDVVMEIAANLAVLLEKEQGCKVILTRRDDSFIPLSERPEIANQAKADLFISVHANASRDKKTCGSQVFIYNREASSSKAAEIARQENRDANYLEIIKDDLRQSVHETDSITLAGLISQELEKHGQETRRIERAPFFVLAKSHMPSVLVETAFISNREEECKIRRREFCLQIARNIFNGVRGFTAEKR